MAYLKRASISLKCPLVSVQDVIKAGKLVLSYQLRLSPKSVVHKRDEIFACVKFSQTIVIVLNMFSNIYLHEN